MKRLIPFLALTLFGAQAFSQAALSPPSPALSVGSVAPAISAPSPSLTLPGASTNPSGTNMVVSINQLAPLLTNLEMNIVQLLPVLSDFNDQFDFVGITQAGQSLSVMQPALSSSSSALVGMGGTASASSLGANASGTASAASGFLLPPGLAGLGTTNGLGNITLTRDSLRALLVLQADMERMLPVLDAVNGGTNFLVISATNAPSTHR